MRQAHLSPCVRQFGKQQLDVALQMIDAFARDLTVAGRLGENKGALQDRLSVPGQTRWRPVGNDAALLHRRRDIRLERCGMAEDAFRTGLANPLRRAVGLLHHGADEAGEFGNVALNDRLAEVDIGEHAIQRIVMVVIRRGLEKRRSCLRPERRRRDAKRFLAVEVMKEGPFGDASRLAQIVNSRCCKTLLAHDVAGRFEKPGSGTAAFGLIFGWSGHEKYIHSGWYVCQVARA